MHFDGVLAFLQYFSKAMQTKYGEYHILSSDLSSKVQVKIRSKVRGLFKRHFVWTGRFFVEFSWRSENSRWKASFRSIVFKISLWTIVNRGDSPLLTMFELTIDFSEWSSLFTHHVTNTEYLQTCSRTFHSPRRGMRTTLYIWHQT